MQPTAPAWVSWYRRVRPRDTPRVRSLAPSRIAVYSIGRDQSTARLIRLDGVVPRRGLATRRPGRFPFDTEPWHLSVPMPMPVPVPAVPDVDTRFHFEPISLVLPPATEAPVRAPGGGWGAARGWAAGTALLAVLLLLVRGAERCLDKKLFRHRNRNEEAGRDDPDTYPSESHRVDLPPPYSECANPDSFDPNKLDINEEPPPPYSACYVSFSNPKDGIPSVHFLNRRQRSDYEIGHSSSENMQNDLMEDIPAVVSPNDHKHENNELTIENGRVVEKKETNLDSVNVAEISVDVGEPNEVVSTNANINNIAQDRIVLV